MRKPTGLYPSLRVAGSGQRVVSMGGSVLLVAAATMVGLDRAMSAALEPWRSPLAVHDPGKVLLDLAIAVAIGGDCLADIGQVRSVPAVFGRVASDPTVSRLIDRLVLQGVIFDRGSVSAGGGPIVDAVAFGADRRRGE